MRVALQKYRSHVPHSGTYGKATFLSNLMPPYESDLGMKLS